MKRSKKAFQFVKFHDCGECSNRTDLVCVVCEDSFCWNHMKECVQCFQSACVNCYKEDRCCLVRPWGEKTERRLKSFYENKLLNGSGMKTVNLLVSYGGKTWRDLRKDVVARSMLYYVENFDASVFSACLSYDNVLGSETFPRADPYVKDEETRTKFVRFIETFASKNECFLSYILLRSEDDVLLSLMQNFIEKNREILTCLINLVLREPEGQDLFLSLKARGMLDWTMIDENYSSIGHVEGLVWFESNGVDVLADKRQFRSFLKGRPVQVMEFLATQRHMSMEYMVENCPNISRDLLEMIHRLQGVEEVQKINVQKIVFDFETVRFLSSIGYTFDRLYLANSKVEFLYPLICFDILKFRDLSEEQRKTFQIYIKGKEVKACRSMFQFAKPIRKEKIMTFLLCVFRIYKTLIAKPIVWKVLDFAYSPSETKDKILT